MVRGRRESDGAVNAVELINKEAAVRQQAWQQVISEKRILYAVDFDFIVELHYVGKYSVNAYLYSSFVCIRR